MSVNEAIVGQELDQDYLLRPAAAADRDFLYHVASLTMRPHIEVYWHWDEDWQASQFRERFIADQWTIVEVDGRPAGGFAVDIGPTALFLTHLYILPAHQRRGVGTSILRRLMVEAQAGHKALGLNVLAVNTDAIRLYRRLGFEVVEHVGEKIRMQMRTTRSEEYREF
jgi:ribosomal protein S18 acetylase RimI-like enzyme